ncbi:rho family-interacting cell polarization regulator 2-like isoform X2 [Salvelinus fontinalis]|uniref:rho family-interacting cell polarization regulator 2-like isoform X2 n=1 Tax=Salvelinus fontinalis TaxID=8038 RepID=UPI0024851201|nr:rho family-interacting cell polarization regulator 2-like isoform X2 [Salvelinus fontinalis]
MRGWSGAVSRQYIGFSLNKFFRGVSSHVPEIMAAGTHSPGGPNGIIRSQSFAGFSTLQERRSRCNSFMGNSAVQKKPTSKPKKPHLSGHKASSGSREPKPERVEEVYGALKQGLDEYLEVHQTGLDKLTSLMKDMKRNSRLGVLYDLDKQIKTIERYMRRLEFHMSKVDELYEAFCIQRRLREGASKMKQAFSASPSTKATRESMSEVNRRYKEYTENMSTLEGELENMLGEFHIKMKGLAGFARLCPGDQYEIFMRYGRQRWKLKGKIEVNSRQSWDGEEIVFMPLITDLINIKVTELKGLATHILVGSVICETKDLFTAMPQVVAVDVNDLGTIKLNLEVTWFPFDVEDLTLSSGNVSKATALQRRVSVYSQGTPETPTFQDQSLFWHPSPTQHRLSPTQHRPCPTQHRLSPTQHRLSPTQHRLSFLHGLRNSLLEKLRRSRSFGDLVSLRPRPKSSLEGYVTESTLPDDVFENGGCGNAECKRLSFTFSDTSVSSPSLAPGQSNPEITITPPETCPQPQIPNVEVTVRIHADVVEEAEEGEEEEESRGSSGSVSTSLVSEEAESEWERAESQSNGGSVSLCSERQLSAVSPGGVFPDHAGPDSDGDEDDSSELLKPVELDTEEPGSLTRQLVRRLTSSDILPEAGVLSWAGEGSRAFLESSLEETLQSLLLRLESLGQRCRELQDLEQEVMRLEDLLKCRLPGHRSRSSSLSLMVESALESFDFLNTSDFDDDDTGDDHALQRSVFFDMEAESIGPGGPHPEARGHLSEALTEDTGVGNSVAGSPLPLTTGNENLDVAIVIHLQYCDHLIQLLSSGGSPWQRRAQLQKLSAQTQLLEELGEISTERLGSITSAADVLPGLAERPARMALWSEWSGSGALFHATLDRVLKHMHHCYTGPLQERHPHTAADTVIRLVVSEMVDRSDLASSPTCHPHSALSQVVFPPSALSQDVVSPSALSQDVVSPSALSQDVFPPSALSQDVVSPSALSQDVFPPSALSQDVFPPSALSQDVVSPSALSQDVVSPSALSQDVVSPSALSQDVVSPSALSQDVVSPSALSQDVVSPSALSHDVVTVFQFHSYVSKHSVEDMEDHLLQVAREAVFAEGLSGGDSERCLKELEEVSHTGLCPRQQTLRALASLLSHQDPQLSEAAAAYITSASSHTPFRSKAVDCYTQALWESGVQTQRSACAALSCLQAVESLRAVVSLCDSADEELRHVAIETLLTFGEEGRLAYEQLDTMPREMVRLGTRRGNAVTTAF